MELILLRNFGFPMRCKRDLRSSGMLHVSLLVSDYLDNFHTSHFLHESNNLIRQDEMRKKNKWLELLWQIRVSVVLKKWFRKLRKEFCQVMPDPPKLYLGHAI